MYFVYRPIYVLSFNICLFNLFLCLMLLTGWVNGSRQMLFAIPMVRRESKDHTSDCYFCLANITGIASKSKHTVKYPDLPSAIRPVPHSEELPLPKPPEKLTFSDDSSDYDEVHGQQEGDNVDCDPTFEASWSSPEPRLLTQGDLNDLVRDLNLSKKQGELLGYRLKW
jgi:hypothetical protein